SSGQKLSDQPSALSHGDAHRLVTRKNLLESLLHCFFGLRLGAIRGITTLCIIGILSRALCFFRRNSRFPERHIEIMHYEAPHVSRFFDLFARWLSCSVTRVCFNPYENWIVTRMILLQS